jgi:ribulose-phosphate 3-epimerase
LPDEYFYDTMTENYKIAPSILSADFTRLGEEIQAVADNGASLIHIDVMDGHFVPNITMGPVIVQACRQATNLPLETHLMISSPDRYITDFAEAGAGRIIVHVEASLHIHRTLESIRESGCQVGIALNPGTPVVMIEPLLQMVDLVLVMTINPGFSGQAFIPETVAKIKQIRHRLDEINPHAMVEVDGGITAETLPLTLGAGAQVFVAATAVYKYSGGVAAGMQALIEQFPG